ncbi:interactor of constitutive active ROPs 3 [Humulus lupulus]|uniref:interactor of constitutive active ROPs 3 n=1 Tax=Humulus lupulus TaxID=3486 RepID=UPI002B40AB63|nr:interactor of constitutive active ROPs 3 [Humulus lupulus]XP_062081992.1 interactor of constitutive active ROPs 3 [Humulus lupulus]XP_062081993.1 interactor of constitutive active ROPs 3 [Humulus lupulus]XP_062081994.1 interactor of constitutive active ROPs 3 [Humulus lupulus]XP_062081995.1 interactor of constitutive active ROPs 3 [Humulus lupulus]XP_062081996.1 interactor of constitutive active ROPs 3 [Humulus lupulus]XP_062081998.1 interactor of constitutive active ROPs 3 [Humulus lupulu
MQTPKARTGTSEVPQRVSPRTARQPKPTLLETDSASSSSQATRTPKERSPKVIERRSPRSPVPEKKRPNRITELESQISQLQEDLKKSREQLCSSESGKKQALLDAEDSKKQLLALSSKLEESQQQLRELSTSEETHLVELQKISQERDEAWQSELEAIQKQHSVDSTALASAVDEIQWLKVQLEMVAASEAEQRKHAELVNGELQSLKGNLAETLSLVENMKNQLKDCKESEAQAQEVVSETLLQLETAKKTVESLRLDGMKAIESYNSIASELKQSRAHVSFLEGLVSKLNVDLNNAGNNLPLTPSGEHDIGQEFGEQVDGQSTTIEEELSNLRSEVGRLRSVLETSEARYSEEQIRSTVQITSAYELMEQIKSGSSLKEAKLESELKKTKVDIEELKANLMDKETELQGIIEENEGLNLKLEKSLSCQREYKLEKELKDLKEHLADLKANLMDKETELQSIAEENEMMKLEIKKSQVDNSKVKNGVAEVEAARSAEREALAKLGVVMEEADRSSKRAARVTEQLDAAQAANAEMEAELRRLKVQSDQWRKAAEAAASMLSAGNNGKFMERTGSLDSNYSPVGGKINSLYSEDMDDDLLKKKNGNMLKKIGVLWKKPQK